MAYTKVKLSGSTDGKAIKVAATATLGTTIHAAHATNLDEVWLWVTNQDTTVRTLTIEWGGATSPDCLMTVSVSSKSGHLLIVPGHLMTNSLVITAFASAANVLMISGYVNRIS
jgi:hypothetical protein